MTKVTSITGIGRVNVEAELHGAESPEFKNSIVNRPLYHSCYLCPSALISEKNSGFMKSILWFSDSGARGVCRTYP